MASNETPSTPHRNAQRPSHWLCLSDRQLLDECDIDVYRASGPGGQKRNKTSSAVRLRHTNSGLIVIAEESRSQHENRERALRRLRQTIALKLRNDVTDEPPPEAYVAALERDSTLRVNPKHPQYWLIVQYVLDVLVSCGVSVGDTATALNISTGNLIRFLKRDDSLWAQVNYLRDEAGLSRLR